MMVYNIMQSIVNDLEETIEQEKYKHPMKININMAVGFVKRFLVKNIVPIRENRHYTRNNSVKNKHSINKRKSF